MKLELHHIAKRLPFGVNILNVDPEDEKDYAENERVLLMVSDRHLLMRNDGDTKGKISIDTVIQYSTYKPILRPLSDLTKEIEHNGEKFVPQEKLRWVWQDDPDVLWNQIYLRGIDITAYELLLDWHFDVDSLIESGLAIDVNSLNENPYK